MSDSRSYNEMMRLEIERLSAKGKKWWDHKKLFIFFPEKFNESQPVYPGMYYFVQKKAEPKTVYLYGMLQHESNHPQLIAWVGLLSKDEVEEKSDVSSELIKQKLLSAGEKIIGVDGKVIAWSLRTGRYYDTLNLINPTDALITDVGLPKENFYSFNDWMVCGKYFQHFLKPNGRFQITNEAGRVNRNQQEELELATLTGDIKKLFQALRTNRDAYELIPPKAPLVLAKKRHLQYVTEEQTAPPQPQSAWPNTGSSVQAAGIFSSHSAPPSEKEEPTSGCCGLRKPK
jgi:hypothetical protein